MIFYLLFATFPVLKFHKDLWDITFCLNVTSGGMGGGWGLKHSKTEISLEMFVNILETLQLTFSSFYFLWSVFKLRFCKRLKTWFYNICNLNYFQLVHAFVIKYFFFVCVYPFVTDSVFQKNHTHLHIGHRIFKKIIIIIATNQNLS